MPSSSSSAETCWNETFATHECSLSIRMRPRGRIEPTLSTLQVRKTVFRNMQRGGQCNARQRRDQALCGI